MSYPTTSKPAKSMEIGLIAYGLDGYDPSLVFVKVPTERGRWVLTDRSVVEVVCPHCSAVVGEPCRRGNSRDPMKHGAGTHWARKSEWQRIKTAAKRNHIPKLRVSMADVESAQGEPGEC